MGVIFSDGVSAAIRALAATAATRATASLGGTDGWVREEGSKGGRG